MALGGRRGGEGRGGDPGRLVRRRTAWIGSDERSESNHGTIRLGAGSRSTSSTKAMGGTGAGESDFAWPPAAWLCLLEIRSTRLRPQGTR